MKSLLNSMSSGVRIRLTDLLVIKMLNCLGLIPDSFSAEAVDAFTQDWSSLAIVGKVLAPTMRSSLVRGTLVVPMSKSAYFWPFLSTNGFHLNSFIADWMYLPSRPDLFVKGRAKNSLFSTDHFKSRCLAPRIDFAATSDHGSYAGFCTSSKGHCFVCEP